MEGEVELSGIVRKSEKVCSWMKLEVKIKSEAVQGVNKDVLVLVSRSIHMYASLFIVMYNCSQYSLCFLRLF